MCIRDRFWSATGSVRSILWLMTSYTSAGMVTIVDPISQATPATMSAIGSFHQRRRGVWRNWLWRLGSTGRAEGLLGTGWNATGAPCCQPTAAGYGANPGWYGYGCVGGWYGYG